MSDEPSGTTGLVFWAVFAAVAGASYVLVMEMNWAAFTYHPRLGVFGLGVEPARSGAAIYWYGWITTAAAIGLAVSVGATLLPRRVPSAVWLGLGWIVPMVAMVTIVYFMLPFFTKD